MLELGRGAGLDHQAVVDHHDLVGEAIGLFEVLRGEQRGDTTVHELVDEIPHRVPAARIEASGGLVEEENRRLARETHGDVETPAHTAGIRLHHLIAGIGEVEAVEQLDSAQSSVAGRAMEESPDVLEVLLPREALVDRGVLAREADTRPRATRILHDVDAVDERLACVGLQERAQDPYEGGLARAIGPEDAEHGRALDGNVDSTEGLGFAEPLSESDRLHCGHAATRSLRDRCHEATRRDGTRRRLCTFP
jgi:hypothetical protein